MDGNNLKQYIDARNRISASRGSDRDSRDSALFSGYIMGVADTLNGTVLCPGEGVKLGQLIGVVAKYVETHPEDWNLPASGLVQRALEPVFPCKK